MYAWIENDVVRDISESPQKQFAPTVAVLYDTSVASDIRPGATLVDGVWTNHVQLVAEPVSPPEPAAPVPPKVDVITYKMLFTSAERIATKMSEDPVIIDLQELMNDPRTQNVDLALKSVQVALDYMTHIGILAAGRKEQILTGVLQ